MVAAKKIFQMTETPVVRTLTVSHCCSLLGHMELFLMTSVFLSVLQQAYRLRNARGNACLTALLVQNAPNLLGPDSKMS